MKKEARNSSHDGRKSRHTRRDQHRIRNRAEEDERQHVLAQKPLTQHEGVLRTNSEDQSETGDEAGRGGKDHVGLSTTSTPPLDLPFSPSFDLAAFGL